MARTYDEIMADFLAAGSDIVAKAKFSNELAGIITTGQVDAAGLDRAKALAVAAGDVATAEALGADIVSRDTGKAATKQKQAKRMAGMTGATSPRTRQQTASLLSSASAAPSTLLG